MRVLAPPARTRPKSAGTVMTGSTDIALAAALYHQPRFGDDDVVRERFAHVVDRQCSDARTGQGFHLDSGLVVYGHRTADDRIVAIHVDGELAALDAERMAERNELVRPLRRHRAGDDR